MILNFLSLFLNIINATFIDFFYENKNIEINVFDYEKILYHYYSEHMVSGNSQDMQNTNLKLFFTEIFDKMRKEMIVSVKDQYENLKSELININKSFSIEILLSVNGRLQSTTNSINMIFRIFQHDVEELITKTFEAYLDKITLIRKKFYHDENVTSVEKSKNEKLLVCKEKTQKSKMLLFEENYKNTIKDEVINKPLTSKNIDETFICGGSTDTTYFNNKPNASASFNINNKPLEHKTSIEEKQNEENFVENDTTGDMSTGNLTKIMNSKDNQISMIKNFPGSTKNFIDLQSKPLPITIDLKFDIIKKCFLKRSTDDSKDKNKKISASDFKINNIFTILVENINLYFKHKDNLNKRKVSLENKELFDELRLATCLLHNILLIFKRYILKNLEIGNLNFISKLENILFIKSKQNKIETSDVLNNVYKNFENSLKTIFEKKEDKFLNLLLN